MSEVHPSVLHPQVTRSAAPPRVRIPAMAGPRARLLAWARRRAVAAGTSIRSNGGALAALGFTLAFVLVVGGAGVLMLRIAL